MRLRDYTLILTGVTSYSEAEESVPSVWISQKVDECDDHLTLHVELEGGSIQLAFRNLRLIRNSDCSVLIPPLDA